MIHGKLPGCSGGGHTGYYGLSSRVGNGHLRDVHNAERGGGQGSLAGGSMSSGIFSDDYADEKRTSDGGSSSVQHHLNNASDQVDVGSGGDYRDKDFQSCHLSSGENCGP